MAVYLTQEEWRCLDLARQGHGCGVPPEDEGNVRRDPGFVRQTLCCVSDLELWTQFEDGGDHREDALMTTGWGQALPNPGQRRGLATIRPQLQKPHTCPECSKAFGKTSHLTKHQHTQTGEWPYQCQVCGKRFRDRSNCSTHQCMHTGEKSYACAKCGKRFSQSSSLVIHRRMHTGKRPYTCTQCRKRFNSSLHFSTHRRTHTGEKPHACLNCGRGFRRGTGLRKHQRTQGVEEVASRAETRGSRMSHPVTRYVSAFPHSPGSRLRDLVSVPLIDEIRPSGLCPVLCVLWRTGQSG
uniref:C2H2-type domain-containing protein n=1 Tax=Sus scrofa TaxID=9823 RepID=A0A8D1DUK4_PIG